MQVDRREVGGGKNEFARFGPGEFCTIPYFLVREMAERRVASNGWPVMMALCRRIYSDGRLGKCSRDDIRGYTGLTYAQIARGMAELRDKGIIVPVTRKTAQGYRHPDRSNFGHVAQYCISRKLWSNRLYNSAGTPGDPPGDIAR
jgi:hypothetical protein